MRVMRTLRPMIGIAGFLVVWQALVMAVHVPVYMLPSPLRILHDGGEKWQSLLGAASYTAQPMLLGFVAAVVFGVLIALGIAFSPSVRAVAYPLLVFLQIVPKIAVAPLFIIWFGFGLTPKVLLVFLLSFFPVVVAAMGAFGSIEPEIMDLARSTGANRLRVFRMVRIPHAMPALFGGFKVAAALAATAAVVAEFVASDRGLGYLLLQYNGNLDTPMSFAAVFVLSVMGFALYAAVDLAERHAIPWHVSRRRAAGDVPGL
jgi:NitT/TauT family transport system permease protein